MQHMFVLHQNYKNKNSAQSNKQPCTESNKCYLCRSWYILGLSICVLIQSVITEGIWLCCEWGPHAHKHLRWQHMPQSYFLRVVNLITSVTSDLHSHMASSPISWHHKPFANRKTLCQPQQSPLSKQALDNVWLTDQLSECWAAASVFP